MIKKRRVKHNHSKRHEEVAEDTMENNEDEDKESDEKDALPKWYEQVGCSVFYDGILDMNI